MSLEEFMKVAIEEARESLKEGNRGYGAVVVKDSKIIARACSTVNTDKDVTAHAEVSAIRKAMRALKTMDLSGCTLFASYDPCTMCGAAIIWANITKVVIGVSIEDREDQRPGIQMPIEKVAKGSPRPVEVIRGVLAEEAKKLPTIRTR